jgi:hypothetical protein
MRLSGGGQFTLSVSIVVDWSVIMYRCFVSIQHDVIKFVSDLQQVGGILHQ